MSIQRWNNWRSATLHFIKSLFTRSILSTKLNTHLFCINFLLIGAIRFARTFLSLLKLLPSVTKNYVDNNARFTVSSFELKYKACVSDHNLQFPGLGCTTVNDFDAHGTMFIGSVSHLHPFESRVWKLRLKRFLFRLLPIAALNSEVRLSIYNCFISLI